MIATTALRPVFEQTTNPINVQDFLKSIDETTIVSIEDYTKEQLQQKYKKKTTLSEVQYSEDWNSPHGIKPNRTFEWEDVISMIETNPDEKFNISDVWVPTSKIYVIKKFNRFPSLQASINNLNFTDGLYWEALDTPTFYIAKMMVDGQMEYILISTIGGHRTMMTILTTGYGSELPSKVIYIGELILSTVSKRAAKLHHIDCNKRSNQTAQDRITSGVEAEDHEFLKIMDALIDMKLFVDEKQMKSDKIKGFRKISSWQNFKEQIKLIGYDHVKYAVGKIQDFTKDTVVLTQSVETIATFRKYFDDIVQRQTDDPDSLNEYLRHGFESGYISQGDYRQHSDVTSNVLWMVDQYHKYLKNKLERRAVITKQKLLKAFGEDKLDLAAKK